MLVHGSLVASLKEFLKRWAARTVCYRLQRPDDELVRSERRAKLPEVALRLAEFLLQKAVSSRRNLARFGIKKYRGWEKCLTSCVAKW